MIYSVKFEADVQGLASVKRINDNILVYAKDGSAARHYAEGYITSAYSENYAITECVPLYVHNMGE